jgi:hypothetical protein
LPVRYNHTARSSGSGVDSLRSGNRTTVEEPRGPGEEYAQSISRIRPNPIVRLKPLAPIATSPRPRVDLLGKRPKIAIRDGGLSRFQITDGWAIPSPKGRSIPHEALAWRLVAETVSRPCGGVHRGSQGGSFNALYMLDNSLTSGAAGGLRAVRATAPKRVFFLQHMLENRSIGPVRTAVLHCLAEGVE